MTRGSMHLARKRRIWTRCGGLCWLCNLPVEITGRGVVYGHRNVLWITEDDSDAAISQTHKACDKIQTPKDLSKVAKVKRLIARKEGTRRPRKAIPSRGFDKSSRPIPRRPFPKRKS